MISIVLILPLIFNYFSLLSKPLRLFQVHQLQLVSSSPLCSTAFLALWQDLCCCISFCVLSVSHFGLLEQQNLLDDNFSLLFFFLINKFGLLVGIGRSVCISKSQKILCISFSWIYSDLCIYHLLVWSNLNLLHNFQWITSPTPPCHLC